MNLTPAQHATGTQPVNRRQFLAGACALALARPGLTQPSKEAAVPEDSIFELRQYTLYGGQRDTLVQLFEEHFVEPQNQLGLHVVGTFRDLDDPDRFVWIRGFRDMVLRGEGLPAFYNGPVWQQYKNAANATMVDSDNVLLLRAARPRPFSAARDGHNGGLYAATIYYLGATDPGAFHAFFGSTIAPWLQQQGVTPLAVLTTETEANNFPRLPMREKEMVFAWIARWPSVEHHRAFLASYQHWSGWRDHCPVPVLPALMRKPEVLRLAATSKSALQ